MNKTIAKTKQMDRMNKGFLLHTLVAFFQLTDIRNTLVLFIVLVLGGFIHLSKVQDFDSGNNHAKQMVRVNEPVHYKYQLLKGNTSELFLIQN